MFCSSHYAQTFPIQLFLVNVNRASGGISPNNCFEKASLVLLQEIIEKIFGFRTTAKYYWETSDRAISDSKDKGDPSTSRNKIKRKLQS